MYPRLGTPDPEQQIMMVEFSNFGNKHVVVEQVKHTSHIEIGTTLSRGHRAKVRPAPS